MEQKIIYIINIAWGLISNWWWVPLPFILWGRFKFFWRWWRWELWANAQKKVLLEIKIPQEVLKPLRAMEQVFTAVWGNSYDPPDWFEKWFEGKDFDGVQLEIASLDGVPHFYVRCSENRRNAIEASIYSQYADAEISATDDYTKYVPQDLPNKEWDLWGTDYELMKPDPYPIKTYTKFFEEKTEAKEEKRVDPMATLLEGMGKLGPGEQLWIQIAAEPMTNKETKFLDKGLALANKLAKRPEKAKNSILKQAAEVVISGKVPGVEPKEESIIPPEMRLTPGEKDILAGIESKIGRRVFQCWIRFIYLAKRDTYFGGAKAIPFGFFNQFATENLNGLKPWPKTLTKVKQFVTIFGLPIPTFGFLMRTRRTFIKKRRLFFRYIKRFPPIFPNKGGTFILDTEELATIYHFPGYTVAPAPFVPRVQVKRGEAPPGLPVE